MQLPPFVRQMDFDRCKKIVSRLAKHCAGLPVDPDRITLEILEAAFSKERSCEEEILTAHARSVMEPWRKKTGTRRVKINGAEYTLTDCVRDDERVRLSFDRLAEETFGISFREWYKNGYWGTSYRPRVLLYDGEVVANVSVNIIDIRWQGLCHRLIQIGTVMTRPEYRGRGLSRYLMESVIREWQDWSDALYLFANDSVLNFYPQFGFVRAEEYQCSAALSSTHNSLRKLDMSSSGDVQLLLERYRRGNPFSALSLIGNEGLLMFYCSQFLKDCVYYSDQFDLVVVSEFEQGIMTCYDIFGEASCSLSDFLTEAAPRGIHRVVFGFSPVSTEGMAQNLFQGEDTTLFVLDKYGCLPPGRWMFPLLSHA